MGHRHLPLEARFWAKVDKRGDDECWLWVGAKAGHMGYGHIVSTPRKYVKSHRLSWEMHFGTIPDGMMVCHRCDVPACVNPSHLFLGTANDNMADCKRKGRHKFTAKRGENNPMAKLSDEQARQIKSMSGTHQKIADHFGVDRSTISFIKRGEHFSHV